MMRQETVIVRFLCLCLRGRWEPKALQEARALIAREDVDWDVLLQEARAGGVTPLLYDVSHGQYLFPPPVEEALRRDYYGNARRNLLFLQQLEGVLRCLAAEGVPVILLKGAALAEAVYGNAALRPMGDLDLLVRQENVPAALRVLSTLGYECPYAEFRPGYIPSYRNQIMVTGAGQEEGPIEIHWRLISPLYYQRAISMDWFWQTARPVRIGSAAAGILGPEAQVLHLCAHLLQHGGEGARLIWLHDPVEVIAHYQDQIDWNQVLARARAYDLVLAVQWVLGRVRENWRTPVPPAVLERLNALCPSPAEERVYALLTTTRRVAQHLWAGLASIPGWRPRARYVWGNLFPSVEYMQHNYRIPHRLLVLLYYPYRWFRSLRQVGR